MFPWDSFWENVYATPFHYVEILFAFLGALAFLLFLRGFLGSIGEVFKQNGHEEHVEHSEVRAIWGVLLLGAVFAVWQMTRTIASWIGFNDGNQIVLGYYIAGIIAFWYGFKFLKKELFSGGGGH